MECNKVMEHTHTHTHTASQTVRQPDSKDRHTDRNIDSQAGQADRLAPRQRLPEAPTDMQKGTPTDRRAGGNRQAAGHNTDKETRRENVPRIKS